MADEKYRPGRRRELPREITDGREVHAFDLQIPLHFLEDDRRTGSYSCLAESGETGGIFVIPARWIE